MTKEDSGFNPGSETDEVKKEPGTNEDEDIATLCNYKKSQGEGKDPRKEIVSRFYLPRTF